MKKNTQKMKGAHTPEHARLFAYQGFKDLLFAYLYLYSDDVFPDFIEYKVIFSQQAVEKFSKALLLKLNPNFDNKDIAKNYNHKIFTALDDIGNSLSDKDEEEKSYFYKNLCIAGLNFFSNFGMMKNDIDISHDKIKHFGKDLIDQYGADLNYYTLFLAYLEFGFREVRYPHDTCFDQEIYKSEDGMQPIIYASRDIISCSIDTCSIIMHFLGYDTRKFLREFFTWNGVFSSFDDPSETLICNYKISEALLDRICARV